MIYSKQHQSPRMKIAAAALLLAASLAIPATAHADCGDPDQPACTGPVPTPDQVAAIMNELTDPDKPAVNKGDIMTPAFDDDLGQKFDGMLHFVQFWGGVLPRDFTVTDIQPAPNNLAGATVSHGPTWGEHGGSAPVVLQYQDGHWMITRHTAYSSVAELVRDKWHGHAI
jgi:hypothetical protein